MTMLPSDPDGDAIRAAFLADEAAALRALAGEATTDAAAKGAIAAQAAAWIDGVRAHQQGGVGIEQFLTEYGLGTHEGVLLMCIAEALLRIPDAGTADRLIRDKLARGDWEKHLGGSSMLVNASTWALMLTGRLTRMAESDERDPAAGYERIVARLGEPVVRLALRRAMGLMADEFVMGRTIDEALRRARKAPHDNARHSFDMLGEAACTAADARRYSEAYANAIDAIGASAADRSVPPWAQPSISVKLSALHPRYEFAQAGRVLDELLPALAALAGRARATRIGFTVDAEEADRLELSLEIVARLRRDPALAGWSGLGLAVQAYQKRARPVIDWLVALARATRTRIPVRLVKGAYWDTEVKRAQVLGLAGYPVFTRKAHTDVSYLACAKALLDAGDAVYPMFASHNAHTVAWVAAQAAARGTREFEFQRLHGMGESLYAQVCGAPSGHACRVYAPVGSHEDLLPYLVRRLLENGANTSFVHRIADASVGIADVVADPVDACARDGFAANPLTPLPRDLYGDRPNSSGVSLADQPAMARIDAALAGAEAPRWRAGPIVGGERGNGREREARDPSQSSRAIGTVVDAGERDVGRALASLAGAQPAWDARGGSERAAVLDAVADAFEACRDGFVARLTREAGKTRLAAIAEVREAVDFCRYYAAQARARFAAPQSLPSPTGETNALSLHGRGVFACISPWNFPLAIFTGQVAAALAAGNTVAAKPAEQTPLVAALAVETMLAAGLPPDVISLLPGRGETVGAALVADARVAGVAFTGSTDVASIIARALASRVPLVPLIAETGGLNAMIADSSALPEQVVADAIVSAFDSAGQRCSALRVLCVQKDIAPRVIALLEGAMDELVVGDPAKLATDVGPVIDGEAQAALERHVAAMDAAGLVRHRTALATPAAKGSFVAPTLVALDRIDRLTREVFGPVLHVVDWDAPGLDALVDAINATGYGLTMGVHSRIDATIARIASRARVGNLYVNRNMIGAVVGVQPFGGEGLSGTGPKAGGPNYLARFAVERTCTVNTAAAGGNAALLALDR
ncbi:RHH-type transcriptional regulator, proline utilization regulon repressor / proline dehydrogenase / delta 1-pyrroline-5-carboxylate dehydrogenase [Burkholderiales bacterium]|nr:RHH-type transcriptional regulator, proline utilization regulon repressor / proline dehydrogenase / delta 1-pyrroline-5-carboxylate dehydrogenase [Burkholderiales bacterium]